MQYYQDITLLPDVEIPACFLWSKVFTQVHIAFVRQKNKENIQDFAVSFPEYTTDTLGRKLRIFAEQEAYLEKLDMKEALQIMKDYIHITNIRKIVPRRIRGYAIYSRYQPDNSKQAKARRYAKRHKNVTYEQALAIIKRKKNECQFPYIKMKSQTNQHTFSLFVQKRMIKREVYHGFGSYGLSNVSSVPDF
jgi:CRISPR-associated endonuclease Csy4